MDAKDLRTEAVLGERSSDGTSKYSHMGTALPCSVNKNYPEISSNPLAKVDTPTSRPCAVIGPDRVVPPSSNTDAYLKKSHYEPWLPTESTFRHPPEYTHKTYQSPIRNISPRQTFQENMQRIMVAPSYNTMKMNDEANFGLDRNISLPKNKLGSSAEPKFCDVPYSINHLSDHQKNTEMSVSNMNNARNCPPMWHPSGVNMRPTRPYGAPELYQYSDYASCAGPRPMAVTRPPHRTMNEESSLLYPEGYYHHGNVRFKPYPNVKERYPQGRYEYVNNYPNPFHPPPPFPQKYDLHKPVASLPSYPQVPIKYLENRMNDPVIDGYQRPNQQINYNAPYQNQMLHPAYGPVLPNSLQSKHYPYPQDKTVSANKLPYENNKMYLDYEISRNKGFADNFYVNDISRSHMKSQVIIPNYPTMNLPPHPYYRKDNHSGKGYDYVPHYRSVDPSINTNQMTRMAPQFSPNGIAISPSDSNTSNDTAHTHGNSLEDCGYVSQSSTASARSIESGFHRIMPNDIHRRYNYGYPSMVRASPFATKVQSNVNHNISSKDKKGIDVRQFLQMWNEGDDENAGNSKETQIDFRNDSKKSMSHFEGKTQEQLYVLGLVNVPSEELGKYEHIQKVSKLPDNIKGYNNIELLKHFEEAIESSNLNDISKTSTPRNFQSPRNSIPAGVAIPARPISPLDVEAKISQSVIHKEVGCNFEIRPCSPEMLNVQVATPVKNILEERVIEKVSNPYQSPTLSNLSDNGRNCNASKQDHVIMLNENAKISSCKLINTQCLNNDVVNVIRPDYSLHDLETNSGVCLASLPRLDNDIELNFQEVNQQFINANKDSVITPKELHSLTAANNSIYQKDEINISDNSYKTKETEKEFSKLSKYRKNKKSETELKEQKTITNSQFIRTDSVIIKNPENIKYFEDSTEYSSNTATLDKQGDILNSSPTITSPSSYGNKNDDNLKEPDSEMAIDFSLNKSKTILEIETNILDGDSSKSSYTVNDNMLIDKNIESNEITVDTNTLNTALTTTKTSTEYNDTSPTQINNSSKKSSACIIEESVAETIADKNTTQELDENIAKETLTKTSTENKDTSLVEINNSSKKNSVNIIEEILSETIADKNMPHKLDEDITKETLTHKYKLESDLCLSSLDSLHKNTEENMIVEDDQETPDTRKELSNLNKNSIEQGLCTYFDINKNRSIACNLYSSATELGAHNINDENRISRSDDFISAEPEIKRKNNKFYVVSPLRASDEQINITNDSNLVQRLSQITDETCHFNSLEDSAYESASLTYDLTSEIINNECKIKNLNLKKRLYSPWIQKLILQNDNNILKSDLINKFFTKISRAYHISPKTDCSKSSSSTEDIVVCDLSANVSNMPNNMETIIHAIEDKKVNFTERGEDIKTPITQIKTLAYSSNTDCEENKFVTLNEIEQNDVVQSKNIEKCIIQDTCSKNDTDEENKALYFNSPLKLPVSPDNPTDVPSVICEDENKKEIKFSTDPSVLGQLPNILLKTFSDGCENEVQKDINYDEPIEIAHLENIPESILNEDCENSCLSVQSEAIKLLYTPKIARSEGSINEYKTNVNEQSLVHPVTSIEEHNNVHSSSIVLKVKIEGSVEPNQKKLNSSVNLIYKSKTKDELCTRPSKVIHLKETENSGNIVKKYLNDSEDFVGKNREEMKPSKDIQLQETENSVIIVKENHKGSEDLEDKSKEEIKSSNFIQLQETASSENIVKENLKDDEDLDGKTKGEIKPTEDTQAQETNYTENLLKENLKDSEDLDSKNKREIKPTKVVQPLETKNSKNMLKEYLKDSEDVDGKSKRIIKTSNVIQVKETENSENIVKENLKDNVDLNGKSKEEIKPTEDTQAQKTKHSENLLKENLKDSDDLDCKSKRAIKLTEVIKAQETKNSENLLIENLKNSEDLDGKSKIIIKTSNVIQVQDTENSEILKDSEDLNGKSKGEIKPTDDTRAQKTKYSENLLKENHKDSEDLESKRKEINPSKVIQVQEIENYENKIKENLKDSEDHDGKRIAKIKPCKDIRVQETESFNNIDNENLKQILEQNFEDSIVLNEPSNLPNITLIPKHNLSRDYFKIVDKDKSLSENYEVMQSPINSIDNNISDILYEDDNSFSVLSERRELNFENSSKTLVKENIEKSSIISIDSNTNDICDVLHEDDNSVSVLNERNVELNLNDSSETLIKGNIENIQDTQHHTIVVTDDQSISRVLEDISFFQNSSNNIKPECENSLGNRRHTLKRSLSDSALNIINTDLSEEYGNGPLTWSKRRRKNNEFIKVCNSNFVTESVCNIQSNRRNSISSVYNEENLSFCIVIDDDCIITQENEGKICFTEVSEDGYPEVQKSNYNEADIAAPTKMLLGTQTDSCEISEPFVLEISDENAFEESWVDDIGCVETVVSDDIAEDVTISAPSSPQDENVLENEMSDIFNGSYGHTDKVKHFYGGQMCNDDAELVETLYRTPQMNVNKTLSNRESHITDDYEELDEYNSVKNYFQTHGEHSIDTELKDKCDENVCIKYFNKEGALNKPQDSVETREDIVCMGIDNNTTDIIKTQNITVNSCESSIDNVFLYNQESDSLNFKTQSSPEVSSTTSEEKSSSLLLKITNYKGMRSSQLNEINVENSSSNCCKFTENINYRSLNNSSKPLITKGAQKYIPPLKEPLDDLKVKLPLPPQSLLKLKQLKISKTMAKQSSSKINDTCKKPKPRFEDVLKSIDEIQFKMHKEKSRKPKKSIPKVVIKKNEHGSHYASMTNKSYFNPDLTGRKWQPWVFIEKDSFIDKMAIKKKTKAIFSHRKNSYVFADKFQKYKSASSAKFIISQPKLDDSSMGHLKYTIRLKHTY